MSSRQKIEAFAPAPRSETPCLAWLRGLLDPESFVEENRYLSAPRRGPFARPEAEGEGLICGYGRLGGQMIFLAAQDASVYRGSIGQLHAEKLLRLCRQADELGRPLLLALDSGGFRAEEGLAALEGLGELLRFLSARSLRAPFIVVLKGAATGALSFLCAAADILIVTDEAPGAFVTPPGVLLAEARAAGMAEAEGMPSRPEALGAAPGLATFRCADAALPTLLRALLPFVNGAAAAEGAAGEGFAPASDPNRCAEELDQMAEGGSAAFAARAALPLVFDPGSLIYCYEDTGPELLCALARLGGVGLAVLACAGPALGAAAAAKARRFLRLAGKLGLPLISFTGGAAFERSIAAERAGLLEALAALSADFVNYPGKRINVYCGAAYGSFLLSFNSKFMGCARAYAWPGARLGLLRPEQALSLFGEADLRAADDPVAARPGLTEDYGEKFASLKEAAAQGLIDEIIAPRHTRPYLYSALQILGCAD